MPNELNKKGKTVIVAAWLIPIALIASFVCSLLGLYKHMVLWMFVAAGAFFIFYILSPQKYVDREDRLFKKKRHR